ncbi:DUF2867 domain-containing protein [Microbacterium sp. LWH12-1.2]|uniref:DUF2867 domain-containing protein n=1 Tax=Microbacterium sp. LWH12-1.2 TaxID=3135259 RepID=UPI003432BABB
MNREPSFVSLAFGDGRFDHGDVLFVSIPPQAPSDPRLWAETMFSPSSVPRAVQGLFAVRMLFASLLGLRPAPSGVFDVREVVGDEALMVFDDEHLDFRCAVGVDVRSGIVRVTTVVRLHGWRGRLYFTPVSLLHPLIVQSMLRRTRRVLVRGR